MSAWLPAALVALGVALVVPLGHVVSVPRGERRREATVVIALGAVLGAASFAVRVGPIAAMLASGWLAATLVLAGGAVARIARRGAWPIEELAIDVGHLYVPVGAVWMTASRAGVPLMGFHEPVVLYTAAHFHFAGFAAPVIAGLVGRELALRRAPGDRETVLASRRVANAYTASTLVVLAGVPLVALGITVSHVLELPATVLLGAGMLGTAVWLARAGARRVVGGELEGALLVVASGALFFSMALAVVFASTGSATRGAGTPLVPYETMAALHGTANAIGFALLSLVALARRPPTRRHAKLGGTWPQLFARGFVGPDFFDRRDAIDASRSVSGQLGSLDDFAHETFHPERVDAGVRAFYEHTERFDLHVAPTWHVPFRTFGRVTAFIGRRVLGQLVLPVRDEDDARVTTRLFAVRDSLDGRTDVRGYVRAYAGPRANFVAAYSTHRGPDGALRLSAAFPLPFSALVGVLRFEDAGPGALYLTSYPRKAEGPGEEGLFLATPFGALRLPMNERIDVWRDPDGALRATHATRLFGLRCFTLTYGVTPRGSK